MKYTKTTLEKLQKVFEEMGYTVRYERGNFQSGYCIVEDRKIAVINKFFDVESRINTLLEILSNVEVDESVFSDKSTEFYKKVKKANARVIVSNNEEETPSEESIDTDTPIEEPTVNDEVS